MGLPAGLSSCSKAKTTQELLWRNVMAFTSAEDWALGSPDLKPRDYKLWAVLEDMACQKYQKNLDSLKSLVKAVVEISMETVCVTIEWLECLKACFKAEAGHFEWHYYK
jgi:hypothetical protein